MPFSGETSVRYINHLLTVCMVWLQVVQCLTELGLNVKKARISSDGGWFVDEFHVTEANNTKVGGADVG